MSSDGSLWSEGLEADIIDLDRYMRGYVKPAAQTSSEQLLHSKQRLIVDGGRVGPATRAVGDVASSVASADSGLSDTFTANTKPRRVSAGKSSYRTACGGSSTSLRAFRTTCEQTLREQQQQIARVAQLCEVLAKRKQPLVPPSPLVAPSPIVLAPLGPFGPAREKRAACDSSDSSDLSSSTRSTRDKRRKDKHRSNQCKTYKIIMNKLDELNKMFECRAQDTSDKVEVTDLHRKRAARRNAVDAKPSRRHVQVNTTSTTERGVGGEGREGRVQRQERGEREAVLSVHTHIVDITPEHFNQSSSAHDERKLESSRTASVSSAVDPGDRFHLQDPILFYSEAKNIRASSQRTRSVNGLGNPREHSAPRTKPPKGWTLCALCRSYWRCIRYYLLHQILCCPETTE